MLTSQDYLLSSELTSRLHSAVLKKAFLAGFAWVE